MVYNIIVEDFFQKVYSMSPDKFGQLIMKNPNLRGICDGYASEEHFEALLESVENIEKHYKPDDHHPTQKGDRVITYRSVDLTIELKTVVTGTTEYNSPQKHTDLYGNEWWTGQFRTSKSRKRVVRFSDGSQQDCFYMTRGKIDIYGVCVRPFTGNWGDYMYCLESDIPNPQNEDLTPLQRSELLNPTIRVQWPPKSPWTASLEEVLEAAYQQKIKQASQL